MRCQLDDDGEDEAGRDDETDAAVTGITSTLSSDLVGTVLSGFLRRFDVRLFGLLLSYSDIEIYVYLNIDAIAYIAILSIRFEFANGFVVHRTVLHLQTLSPRLGVHEFRYNLSLCRIVDLLQKNSRHCSAF